MTINTVLLVEHNISPNEYYYLYHLANQITLPINSSLCVIDYHKLEKKEFIKISDQIYIRQKAINIFKEQEYVYDEIEDKMTQAISSVEKWIDEWRVLFPTQKQYPQLDYPLQGSKQDCIKKMKSFIKTHYKKKKLDKMMIFNATKLYIEERRKDNYKFTKMANYFISKDGISFLEMYVNKLIEMKEDNISIDNFINAPKSMIDDI